MSAILSFSKQASNIAKKSTPAPLIISNTSKINKRKYDLFVEKYINMDDDMTINLSSMNAEKQIQNFLSNLHVHTLELVYKKKKLTPAHPGSWKLFLKVLKGIEKSSLKELLLLNFPLQSEALSQLAKVLPRTSITKLNCTGLSHKGLDLEFTGFLEFLQCLPKTKLESLSLFMPKSLRNESFKALAQSIRAMSSLKALDLNFENIDENILSEFCEIIAKTPLEKLTLTCRQLLREVDWLGLPVSVLPKTSDLFPFLNVCRTIKTLKIINFTISYDDIKNILLLAKNNKNFQKLILPDSPFLNKEIKSIQELLFILQDTSIVELCRMSEDRKKKPIPGTKPTVFKNIARKSHEQIETGFFLAYGRLTKPLTYIIAEYLGEILKTDKIMKEFDQYLDEMLAMDAISEEFDKYDKHFNETLETEGLATLNSSRRDNILVRRN